jgi:hypothetical protein
MGRQQCKVLICQSVALAWSAKQQAASCQITQSTAATAAATAAAAAALLTLVQLNGPALFRSHSHNTILATA